MTNLKSEFIKEKEERRKFIDAVYVYDKTDNDKLKDYTANIIADGFIRYSKDEVEKITLDVVMDDVVKHEELVKKIKEKAEKADIEVILGKYTKKHLENSGKNDSKEKDIEM